MISDRINRLSESATIAMAQKSRELKNQGLDIISLALGEPDFNTPDFVKEAAHTAIDENYSKYMPVPGYLDLREAISHKFKRDNGLSYDPSQIQVSTGAKQAIANVVLSLVNPGEEVLLPAPFWVTYEEIVKLAGGIPKIIKTSIEDDFKMTAELLEENIGPNTKLMIFSSPCNPTGSVYSEDELRNMAKVIAKNPNFYVVSDEIYEHINFVGSHFSLANYEGIFEQVVTINGVSKAFAMTGWRIGYMGAPKQIADACIKMQGQFTSGASSIAQRAALAAVAADPSVTHDMRAEFLKRRNFMLGELKNIEGFKVNEPEGAFYIFPEVSALFGKSYNGRTIQNSDDLCMYLLEEGLVAVVTGDAFGAPGYFRISYAASEADLKKATERIKSAISKLA
jgi:aspartate aminotransferase